MLQGGPTIAIAGDSSSDSSESLLFIKCVGAVLVFHMSAAFCTENVFRQPDFHYSAFYSLVELGIMAAGTGIERRWVEKVPLWERRAPLQGYAMLGLLYMTSRFVSFYSLELIDFRTQVMWKNAKLPVTMVIRSLLLSVHYPLRKYGNATIFVIALIFFTAGAHYHLFPSRPSTTFLSHLSCTGAPDDHIQGLNVGSNAPEQRRRPSGRPGRLMH